MSIQLLTLAPPFNSLYPSCLKTFHGPEDMTCLFTDETDTFYNVTMPRIIDVLCFACCPSLCLDPCVCNLCPPPCDPSPSPCPGRGLSLDPDLRRQGSCDSVYDGSLAPCLSLCLGLALLPSGCGCRPENEVWHSDLYDAGNHLRHVHTGQRRLEMFSEIVIKNSIN